MSRTTGVSLKRRGAALAPWDRGQVAGQRGTEESFAEADQSNWSLGNRVHKKGTSEVRHILGKGGGDGGSPRMLVVVLYGSVVRTLIEVPEYLYKFDDGTNLRDWHGLKLTSLGSCNRCPSRRVPIRYKYTQKNPQQGRMSRRHDVDFHRQVYP